MQLSVYDENGVLVADAELDPSHPLREGPDGSAVGHAIGRFTPGPGFGRIEPMLAALREVYATGDFDRALVMSDDIDALGMWATDSAGRRFAVSNVQFQQDGLLFFATYTPR